MRKKKRQLEKDRYRIIKLSKEALWEFIYESVLDKQEVYFDLSDGTEITAHFDINFETGDFVALVRNSVDDEPMKGLRIPDGIDLQGLLERMEDTTSSMYQPDRYKEYSLDEIIALQSERKI